ncbi:MAG: hypothetical protein P8J32_04900 [bacterium]|nr:hypothetical protein [bacterium]
MKDKWLVSPEDDLLKIMDINESPNVDQEFKDILNAMMQTEFVDDIDPYVAEDDLRTEFVASPFALLEAAEAAAMLDKEDTPEKLGFIAKLKSLASFCEEQKVNYVRFSI